METPPLTDLLAKIDATQPAPTPLPSDDAHAVARHDARFRDRLADHQSARATLQALASDSRWLDQQRTKLLEQLDEDDQHARDELVENLIAHFQRAHALALRAPERDLERAPDERLSDQVVAWVLGQLGGRSFLDVATDELRERFARRVYHPKRNGRALTLGRYLYIDTTFGDCRLSYGSDESLTLLARALTRFEREQTAPDPRLHNDLLEQARTRTSVRFGAPLPTSLERCPELVIFKNGNVRVLFRAPADADAFVAFYGLRLSS